MLKLIFACFALILSSGAYAQNSELGTNEEHTQPTRYAKSTEAPGWQKYEEEVKITQLAILKFEETKTERIRRLEMLENITHKNIDLNSKMYLLAFLYTQVLEDHVQNNQAHHKLDNKHSSELSSLKIFISRLFEPEKQEVEEYYAGIGPDNRPAKLQQKDIDDLWTQIKDSFKRHLHL